MLFGLGRRSGSFFTAMNRLIIFCVMLAGFLLEGRAQFVTVRGVDLVTPDGEKLFIKGTNLGNWLNPEGYMFRFRNTNSAHFIDEMLRQLVGPEEAAEFWKRYKNAYVSRKDIEFIKATGSNTVRMPLHYKLFTDEDYLGLTSSQDGFARIDSVVTWCRDAGLYLILDMHAAPGGQTGDNIDDSHGYPWIFESERSRQRLCGIWRTIAARYADEPVVLGYELLNEPIPHYLENKELLKPKLESLYRQCVSAIREVDGNHIVLLGGAEWNNSFEFFKEWDYDDKLMFTCHRYGGEPTAKYIDKFIEFRDKTGRPMYMGEIGHNTEEWQRAFCKVLEDNNIGYTFWPFKKMGGECFVSIPEPENWGLIVGFAEADRSSYKKIREARPSQEAARQALSDFLELCRFENCLPQQGYIESIGLSLPKR